jgi:hypothetical protein
MPWVTAGIFINYGNALWNNFSYSLLAIWFIAIGSGLLGFSLAIILISNDLKLVYFIYKKQKKLQK